MKNRYGLDRDIPAPIQRAVRQRCGFGCVVCGCAIYQYEHLQPPFHDATQHDPEGIVLLCGGCHDRKTRGLLSAETVFKASRSPKALAQGFSFGPFDIGAGHPEILLGTVRAKDCSCVINVFGEPLFSVRPPEEVGGPFQLSALFCDGRGAEVLRIENNEWRAPTDQWDIEVIGPRISIRRASRDLTLQLRSDPPHSLVVERLSMYFRGARLECESSGVFRATVLGGSAYEAFDVTAVGCEAALYLSPTQLSIGYHCKGGVTVTFARVVSPTAPVPARRPPRIGRNDPCPCGSGTKHKKCHGRLSGRERR